MDQNSQAIIAQVATKEACKLLIESGPVDMLTLEANLDGYVEQITRSILHGISVCEAASPAPKPESRPLPASNANTAARAFGTTVEQENPRTWSVRVKGEQFTENGQVVALPDWLFSQAADKGVSEVWDNRKDLATSSSNIPWFKQVVPKGEKAVGFWPPR